MRRSSEGAGPEGGADQVWPRVRAVLFDFDGTLTRPETIDFVAMRRAIGCPEGLGVLEFVAGLPNAEARLEAMAAVDAIESEAALAARPNPGAEACVGWLREAGLPLGILTRNSRRAVELALGNFASVGLADFVTVVTREDVQTPKPDPEGVHLAAMALGTMARELVLVGDFHYDVEAGKRAGCRTVLLWQGAIPTSWPVRPDLQIDSLADLPVLIAGWL